MSPWRPMNHTASGKANLVGCSLLMLRAGKKYSPNMRHPAWFLHQNVEITRWTPKRSRDLHALYVQGNKYMSENHPPPPSWKYYVLFPLKCDTNFYLLYFFFFFPQSFPFHPSYSRSFPLIFFRINHLSSYLFHQSTKWLFLLFSPPPPFPMGPISMVIYVTKLHALSFICSQQRQTFPLNSILSLKNNKIVNG